MLAELLEEIGNQQVVIWMNFVQDFHQLHNMFPTLQGKIGYIYGEVDGHGETRSNIINDFKTGRIQYIACNPASVGHGITLINPQNPCSNVIYFDLDYSLEKFEQSQDRVHRIGQKFVVNYYAILAENSIDFTIWDKLQHKKTVLADAMEYLK
jgi:SNF2 family DNA or RNA helicase